jgi:molybdopterin/thiamine biosynthesis adenylyltransferase
MIDRAEGLLDEVALKKTHIGFVGLGSGGSAGLDLLRYPFGRIDLIDPDKLAKENVVRHVLTARDVGRFKVEAMREAMIDRNISASTIFAHAARVEDVLHKIPKPDILVVGIDDPVSQAFVNSWCVENGVFALYPGVYAKGVGGQIIVVPTPRDLCQQCAVVMMGMPAAERPTGPSNYGVDIDAQTEKKVKAIPCLSWAITSIATEVARYVVSLLNLTYSYESMTLLK